MLKAPAHSWEASSLSIRLSTGVLCTRAVLAKCVVGEGSFEITDSVLASPGLRPVPAPPSLLPE